MNLSWQNITILFLFLPYVFVSVLIICIIVYLHNKNRPKSFLAYRKQVLHDIEKRKAEIQELYNTSPEDAVLVGNSFLKEKVTDSEMIIDHILVYTFLQSEGYSIHKDTNKWVKIEQRTKSEGL